jgi:hypothetical protein
VLSKGVDNRMCHVLRTGAQMEHRNTLRKKVDGQPEHLCVAAEPCSQFVQLQGSELEVAERVLVQSLSVHVLRATGRW